jgi:hypothetical protein
VTLFLRVLLALLLAAGGAAAQSPANPPVGSVWTYQPAGPVWAGTATGCPLIETWGGKADNTTDTVPAWTAAWAAGATCIAFHAGTYYFSAGVSNTMVSSSPGMAIIGVGSTLTKFRFAAGGITLNYYNKYNSVALSGFAILNGTTGGTAITLNRTTSDTMVSLDSPGSTLFDIVAGPYTGGNDWATCFVVNGVSYVNYRQITCNNTPQAGYGGTVNGLVITGTSTNPSVMHNISASNFNWGNCGIVLNAYTEGITVTGGSNFTVGNKGICVPAGMPNNYYQLTVSDSQFNNNVGIEDLSGLYNTVIHHNIFILQPNAKGVHFASANYVIVQGNTFNATASGANNGTIGVDITTSLAAPAPINQITGNQFGALATGILLESNTTGNIVGVNAFINNTHNITDNGPVDVAGSNAVYDQVQGAPPTVTAGATDCGTAPFPGAGANDLHGNIVVGTGANGGHCTVTFSQPFARTPFCMAQNVTNPAVVIAADDTTVTGFVLRTAVGIISCAAALEAGDHISYHCSGYQ